MIYWTFECCTYGVASFNLDALIYLELGPLGFNYHNSKIPELGISVNLKTAGKEPPLYFRLFYFRHLAGLEPSTEPDKISIPLDSRGVKSGNESRRRYEEENLQVRKFFSLFNDSSLFYKYKLTFATHLKWMKAIASCRGYDDVITVLKTKLEHCVTNHKKTCEIPLGRQGAIDIFVIDTKKGCIIPYTTASLYFALSYVWGDSSQTRMNITLTMNNREMLSQPGALWERIIWDRIPRVVQQTISLMQEIGISQYQYLWVDALCITQDDAAYKHTQIMNMDIIYSHAAMTIVAEAADSAIGNLNRHQDKRGFTDFTKACNTVSRVKGVRLFSNGELHMRSRSVHSTRGWTFQEEILSRRILYCSSGGTTFSCQNNRSAPSGDLHTLWNWSASDGLTSSIVRYQNLVTQYTGRHLTFEKDILNAFSGAIEALKLEHLGYERIPHFVCGIPATLIAYNLFWATSQKPNTSSIASQLPATKNTQMLFPTWSWASCASKDQILFPESGTDLGKGRSYNATSAVVSLPCLELQGVIIKEQESSRVIHDAENKTLRANDVELRWKDNKKWPQLSNNVFHFLRITTIAMPWPPKLKPTPISHQNVWQSKLFYYEDSPMSHRGVHVSHRGWLSISPDQFDTESKGDLSILVLYQRGIESTAALIVRRVDGFYTRVAIAEFIGLISHRRDGTFVPSGTPIPGLPKNGALGLERTDILLG